MKQEYESRVEYFTEELKKVSYRDSHGKWYRDYEDFTHAQGGNINFIGKFDLDERARDLASEQMFTKYGNEWEAFINEVTA